MGDWLIKLLLAAIMQLFSSIIEGISEQIENVFNTMNGVMETINFGIIEEYASSIALALVVLFAVKQGIMVYVLHTDGDPDSDSLEMLTRFSVAVCMILCGPWFIHKLTEIAAALCSEVDEKVAEFSNDTLSFGERIALSLASQQNIVESTMSILPIIILFIGTIILMFVFMIKAMKRSAEIILFAIMIPLFSLDLLSTNKEKWNEFISEAMICIFGYILQVFCYGIFMGLMRQACIVMSMEYMIACFCWLLLCLGAPKWLQKFTYSSGAGNAAKGGARSAMMYIPRMVGKK